jgi:hypothetical protein
LSAYLALRYARLSTSTAALSPRSDLEFGGGLGVAFAEVWRFVAIWRRTEAPASTLPISRFVGERDGVAASRDLNCGTAVPRLSGAITRAA